MCRHREDSQSYSDLVVKIRFLPLKENGVGRSLDLPTHCMRHQDFRSLVLEDELARELNSASGTVKALSYAEVAVGEVGVWAAQAGMIEGVEHFDTGLKVESVIVAESSVLRNLQVQILEAGIVYADRTWRAPNLKGEWLREDGWVEQQDRRIAFCRLARKFCCCS